MAPLAHARRDGVAGFEDDEVDAALDQVRCGGKSDRAGADDRDRQGRQAVVSDHAGGQIEQGHSILPGYR